MQLVAWRVIVLSRSLINSRSSTSSRVEFFRRRAVARPLRAERAGEGLRLLVALARHGEDAPTLRQRHLGDDVRGGAEAVQAEPLRVAGEP